MKAHATSKLPNFICPSRFLQVHILDENRVQSYPFWPKSKYRPIRYCHSGITWIGGPTREENQRDRSQDTTLWQLDPENSPMKKREGRWAQLGGQPTSPWAHHLQAATCHSLIGSLSRFKRFHQQFPAEDRVAPLYVYEGRGSISSNTHPSSQHILLKLFSQDVVHLLL